MLVGRARSIRNGRLVGRGDASAIARDGASPTFLALHGFTGTPAEVAPIVARVSEAGYAVRAPLLPGHGSRADALQDIGWEEILAGGRAALHEALARGPVVLAGFSLGSVVAMELALEAPPGLVGLVVLASALRLAPMSAVPLGLFHRARWALPDWFLIKPQLADVEDRAAGPVVRSYDRHPIRGAFALYQAGLRVRREVSGLRLPMLILHGAKDRVCPAANAPWLAARVASEDVTLRVYPRTAHLIAADHDKQQVGDDVVSFVRRLARSTGQAHAPHPRSL